MVKLVVNLEVSEVRMLLEVCERLQLKPESPGQAIRYLISILWMQVTGKTLPLAEGQDG